MNKSILARLSAPLFTLLVILVVSSSAFGAATIVIQNNDPAGTGFNDPTPVASVGGNPGTTLGQQRLNAFQLAANIWGATLVSNTTITVGADWQPLSCSSSSAVLGGAGANSIWRDFSGAPYAGTWYSGALANALTGRDMSPGNPEIIAHFNINLGNAGCLDGVHFYLGLDNNHGNDVDLVTVLLHEFSHGLGFQTFTNASTGALNVGFPSVYDRFLYDNTSGKTWVEMTDGERQASAQNTGKLAWNGPVATNYAHNVLASPRVKVNSPAAIAGNYEAGAASFGPQLSYTGMSASVVQALDAADGSGPSTTDGCSPLTNAAAVAGKIALIDRGTCAFVTKVKNAQNASALGVLIVDNVAGSPPPTLGGSDSTITISSARITMNDGNTIKAQLAAGVNATMLLDRTAPGGADALGRPLLFAPNPLQAGSSVSHWDISAFPNQLMEPNITGDLAHTVTPPQDLTSSLMRDIGWVTTNAIDQPSIFVKQHYADFLNREPDGSGLDFWTRQITDCGSNQACIDAMRVNVSAAFYVSIEFQETGYLVYRIYKSAYGNVPGTPVPVRFNEFLPDTQQIGQGVQVGVGNWQTQLETNKQNFAANFVSRSRFTSAYPTSLTPAQFVDTLFANAGLSPSATERTTAINEFGGAGTSADTGARARALRRVAENSTLAQQEFNRAFVLMQYFGYLRRNPSDPPEPTLDFAGYNFWLSKLNQFNGDYIGAEMVKAFVVSGEYRQRFGP